MFFALAFLAAAAASPSDTCKKLTRDFDNNEKMFAMFHDLDQRLYEIERKAKQMRAAADARKRLEETDQKYKAEGDRITTLLIANKCTPPDHVTTWYTYSTTNPDAKKPEQSSEGE